MKGAISHYILRPIYRAIMRKLAIKQNVIYQRDLHVARRSTIMAPDKLVIGANVSIGMDTWIAVNGVIEEGVLISSYVGIIGRYDHILERPGQSPVDALSIYDPHVLTDHRHHIHIERNVWIGYKATILSGIRIGRGAVIAAGAVVTKDVAPYAIVAGNPARQIGSLFTDAEIAEHEGLLAATARMPKDK